MEDKMIGIAKRNISEDEIFELELGADGEIMQNEHINFIEGTKISQLIKNG